ncbi:MAG: HlyC/CorC family transporter [Burkholderiales bacterium]|nr:HlyC/CorC family transporter [Burkholderiales bacterium]
MSALLAALAVLLCLSAFFSLSETSMMSLNRYRLRHLVREGHRGARLASRLLARTDQLLGVILLGNNLVNAAAASLVTVIVVRLLGSSELAVTVATLSVTFLILVFAEVTPKVVAAAYPEPLAFFAAYVLRPVSTLLYPAVWVVNLFVRGLLMLLHLRPHTVERDKLGLAELRSLVLEASGYLPATHQTILLNLFDLENLTVEDVMTPRGKIEAIDIEAGDEAVWQQLTTAHHSLLPVYQGEPNNVIGVVHVRQVLHAARSGPVTTEGLKKILREPYFIPMGTPLFTQLQNFQQNQRKVGLVVDEYGELQGLLTMEDILEEIVGEFTRPAPSHGGEFQQEADGSWLVDGGTPLRELNRKLGTHFPLDGPRTLNGLILEHFQDIPEAGVSLKIAGHPLEIVQTQGRLVKVVRIHPEPEEGTAEKSPLQTN